MTKLNDKLKEKIITAYSIELKHIKFGKFVFVFGTVVMNAKTKTFTLPYTPNHGATYPVTGFFNTESDVGTYGNLVITNNSKTANLHMNAATTRAVTNFIYLTDE